MQSPLRTDTWILGDLDIESREMDAERYSWIWTNHTGRTTPRSREDLVLFIFKLNHSPHACVKLNHLPAHTSSPRDSDSGGQSKEETTGMKGHQQTSSANVVPFMKSKNPPSFPAPERLLHSLKALLKLLRSLKLKGNFSKVIIVRVRIDDWCVSSLWAQKY